MKNLATMCVCICMCGSIRISFNYEYQHLTSDTSFACVSLEHVCFFFYNLSFTSLPLNWNSYGVPQMSVVRPVLFVTFISDLPLRINSLSDTIIFADCTGFIISSKYFMILVHCQMKLCLIWLIGLLWSCS